jgi:hypothetical protein
LSKKRKMRNSPFWKCSTWVKGFRLQKRQDIQFYLIFAQNYLISTTWSRAFFRFRLQFFFVNFWSWVLQEKKKGKNFLTLTTFTRSTGKNCENALDHVVDILFFYKMSHNMLILDIWCARNPLTHP